MMFVLKFYLYTTIAFIMLSIGCQKSSYTSALSYSQSILAAKTATISDSSDFVKIHFGFDREVNIRPEYRASVGLVTFYDSAFMQLAEQNIRQIAVHISDQSEANYSYSYAIADVERYKELMQIVSESMQNLLNKNIDHLAQKVDADKISKQNLEGLIEQIVKVEQKGAIENYTIDGFKLDPEHQVIQIGVTLPNPNNITLNMTFQVNMKSKLVTYIGINDGL